MSKQKKEKSKIRQFTDRVGQVLTPVRLRVLLSLICVAAIAITTWMAWPSFFEEKKQGIDGAIDYLPYRLNAGDQIVQNFNVRSEGLSAFTLSFDLAEDLTHPSEVQLKLEFYEAARDQNINLDNSARTPVYDLVVDGDNINKYTQTELPVSLGKYDKGQEFELVLTVLSVPEQQRMDIHTNNAQLRSLRINGRETGLALTMTLKYISFNWSSFYLALSLMLVVLILLVLPVRLIGDLFTRFLFIPLLLAPALLVGIIELFNSLNHDYWLKANVFWLSYLTVLLIELMLTGILGSCRRGIYLNLAIFAGLAIGNHTKLFFRGDPFVAGDLRVLTEAAQTVNNLQFEASHRFLLGMLLLLIYVLLFISIGKKDRRPAWRLTMALVPLIGLITYMNLIVMDVDRMDKWFKVSRYPWNNMMNYKINGFTIPFFQSVHHLVITTPDHDRTIDNWLYELPEEAKSESPGLDKPHIIAIMSESFANFNNIKTIETSEPVLPFYDQLTAGSSTIDGNLLVSIFGGGTCNTEFEFLTGSSMLFMNDGIIPYTSYFDRPTHALPELLSEQGYSTLAIHPYYRTFWDRNKVYPNMGFDRYIALEDFPEGGLVRQFVSDQSAFEQIVGALEENQPGERQFIFTVTMQNHFPYYGEEEILAGLNYNIKMPGLIDVEAVELYLSILRESDDALRYLVSYLETVEEPVILVFFGDHLPGNNNVFNTFYESLFNKPITDLNLTETQKMYETPYLIWANYDLPELDMPLTSPNFLGTTMLELAGAKTTPYFDYVSNLQDSITAMSNKLLVLQNGRRINREQIPNSLTRLLDRYWRYEYDNIIAKKES